MLAAGLWGKSWKGSREKLDERKGTGNEKCSTGGASSAVIKNAY